MGRRPIHRECCSTLALAAALYLFAAWPILATAQSPERVYRLGHLAQATDSERITREFSLPELAKLGFVEGRNLEFIVRSGIVDALPDLARELLATKPDVIIAISGAAALAVREATNNVPIVLYGDDPVRSEERRVGKECGGR